MGHVATKAPRPWREQVSAPCKCKSQEESFFVPLELDSLGLGTDQVFFQKNQSTSQTFCTLDGSTPLLDLFGPARSPGPLNNLVLDGRGRNVYPLGGATP